MNQPLSDDLAVVKNRFEDWRNSRQGQEPVPDELRKAALQMLKHYPIGKVSKELKLNYDQIRRYQKREFSAKLQTVGDRTQALGQNPLVEAGASPTQTFLEICAKTLPQVAGAHASGQSPLARADTTADPADTKHESKPTPQPLESVSPSTSSGRASLDDHLRQPMEESDRRECRVVIERVDGSRLSVFVPADRMSIEALMSSFLRA